MSFMLTKEQFRNRTKSVTRRLGWWKLKPGDVLMGVEKGQGIPKGGKVVRLGAIRIVKTERQELAWIKDMPYGKDEVVKEGFPNMTAQEFVDMFCKHNNCHSREAVNRIEFEYL